MNPEKTPQSNAQGSGHDFEADKMPGMMPPATPLMASITRQGNPESATEGVKVRKGWQQGYFYAVGTGQSLYLVPGAEVQACGIDDLTVDRGSLLAGFAARGLSQPDAIFLMCPSDPGHVFLQQISLLSAGGRNKIPTAPSQLVPAKETLDVQQAAMPGPLAFGNEIHFEIARQYRERHGKDGVFTNSIPMFQLIKYAQENSKGGDPTLLHALDRLLRPDITNFNRMHLYEIKPIHQVAQGEAEMRYYLTVFHNAGVKGMTAGEPGEAGTSGLAMTSQGPVEWSCLQPGLITYARPRSKQPQNQPETQPRNVPVAPGVPTLERPRTKAPEHMPLTPSAPESVEPGIWDLKYWETLTGLTGWALIAYLIISEGSRLFPARNLVPIP